ncbi:concanavalin A-like lectin/glucanase domain-containing protein [Ampelomyces quisqualis]|uniref:Concanavalin A-like lectin/glucanase domain-containing protein n=1 Tax=Ampelomyces quisqualis TaxID=50730 RepID=A0A6A5QXT7_AMPQU|nr:concanavalin A-like lectin/glucanase domain-containing protein [Ampelomyces quisqualis]
MYITSQSLRAVAWSTLAFSATRASYVIDNLSFGQKEGAYISPDLQTIPHWIVQGIDDYMPQILTDRVILTPPYPGSKRSSLWTSDPLHHSGDWTAELDFRATGMDRGAGNLQFWYVKESQARETPQSLYTAKKFDGLVLVIDQYEGRGGSVRGFLNDGSIDIGSHPDPDTLAFGKCDHAYRNRGLLSSLKLHHADGFLEVMIDGESCFKTDKVNLPEGYYFGISASSAENPDSFEVHKFIVSTTNTYTREEPNKNRYPSSQSHQDQANMASKQGHEQQTHKQQQLVDNKKVDQMLEDVLASSIRSQQDQFADLHNRIQIINNRVAEMHEMLEGMVHANEQRFTDLMNRVVPIDDRSAATIRNVEKVERTTTAILRDLESKDFKDMMKQIHRTLEQSHEGLSRSLPAAMDVVYGSHKPSMTSFLLVAVAVQIMVMGAYLVYKKRRNGAPKKYL